ncbi:cutinase-domain-containing protein [Coniochaeta sp. 2T2.1]|nr:cutinase-domain-containing protein [Coniochaeta sp. 2T2.1]
MQSLLILALAALSVANPLPVAVVEERTVIEERQSRTGTTSNEFTKLGCRNVLFFFARGSTEVGNMGSTVGPPTSNGIKSAFGVTNVATEGIDYAALLSTNFLPGGADLAGIAEMRDLLNQAASKCPSSKLVVAGYSQGAALVHRAVENLSQSVKDKIVAAVTYGDTQNLQDRGQIPNFPTSKTLIICNVGDAVCAGTLTILPAHLAYTGRVDEAVAFISARIRAS